MLELTIAIILEAIVIIAILVLFGWYIRESNKDKTKLLNGILAKSPQDMVNMTLADNTIIEPEVNKPDPDLMNMETLSDEEFDAHIQKTLGNQIEDEEIV